MRAGAACTCRRLVSHHEHGRFSHCTESGSGGREIEIEIGVATPPADDDDADDDDAADDDDGRRLGASRSAPPRAAQRSAAFASAECSKATKPTPLRQEGGGGGGDEHLEGGAEAPEGRGRSTLCACVAWRISIVSIGGTCERETERARST